ncbi:radical S-adenosyl methionine domain-containing protein 1 [Coemansia javaensis]|uniref:Radical S-adenosyl methionine domain-containing protein 1, mitochondrial n=1 Tax=Coemansia javaensis TaxID=2761396 RepID=A0A9W8LG73_9FUNG|nr:radical S-adenosyl methionine domain-containing protein 1 [Coemansia javaensis]
MAVVPLSLYVHWPFCSFLCRFCAFAKAREPAGGADHERVTAALVRELETQLAPHADKELRSIYFGGGTPSLAEPRSIGRIIEAAGRAVRLAGDAEITLESNPTSAEVAKMRAFRAAGVTRYSIGVQTLDDGALRAAGRLHTGAEGLAAVDRARALFPGRVSFDMMFGFAGQTPAQWRAELETALAHADGHVSVYQLTVEPGTPLFRDRRAQRVVLPGDDAQAQMYEAAVAACAARGLRHYEVSSYAAPGAESVHNMGYWQGRQWVGIGPSAHSRFVDPGSGQWVRSVRTPDIRRWVQGCEDRGHGTARTERISSADAAREAVVLGLRTLDGLSLSGSGGGGHSTLGGYLRMDAVAEHAAAGRLWWDAAAGRLAPTERGLAVIDSVLLDILP